MNSNKAKSIDIQTTKNRIGKDALEIENPSLIEKIHKTLTEESDFWNSLSKQEKKEIQLSLSQLDKGERISVDDYLTKVS